MKSLANTIVAMSLAFPALSHAHPGHHAGGAFAAWLRHMLLSPDHLPVLILAGLIIVLGVVLIDRWARRRGRSVTFRDRG